MKSARELFGERIKEIRCKRGMIQEDIARILDIDPKSFSRIETGLRSPSLDTIEKIACALSVELKDLFEYEHLRGTHQIREACQKMIDEASLGELKILLRIIRAVMR